MNPFTRWLRFNLVGVLGMAVQLATLSALNHLWHGHYLLATAAALELTLLHNFAWHWNYTWRDRRHGSSAVPTLLRFHLTNGLTSLIGNLALMHLLVHTFHAPVLVANIAAILACSLLNFAFSHLWAFPSPSHRHQNAHPHQNGCPTQDDGSIVVLGGYDAHVAAATTIPPTATSTLPPPRSHFPCGPPPSRYTGNSRQPPHLYRETPAA